MHCSSVHTDQSHSCSQLKLSLNISFNQTYKGIKIYFTELWVALRGQTKDGEAPSDKQQREVIVTSKLKRQRKEIITKVH